VETDRKSGGRLQRSGLAWSLGLLGEQAYDDEAVSMAGAAASHLVQFYTDAERLAAGLSSLFADPLRRGETVVVVAQGDHRDALDTALDDAGVDLAAEYRSGRYLTVDADEALARFMTTTGPDAERFRSTVGSMVLDARWRTGSVHAYGEMVGILAAQGDLIGALELENLWNQLIHEHPFRLLCGYPRDVVVETAAFDGICAAHASVVVPREAGEPALSATVDLPLGPNAAKTARRAAREVLSAWGLTDAAGLVDASAVVSELVTAGGRRGARRVHLGLGIEGDHIVISVTDGVPPSRRRHTEEDLPEAGRLFSVLSILAQSWGVQSLPDTSRLWARVPTNPTRS
jgi:MEDS: MEthanogen/methylotroph, DcmR Sensory domain